MKRNKRPAWPRMLDIVVRTAHVIVTSVLFGGAVYGISYDMLFPWFCPAAGTGIALIVSEACHRRHWAYQGRGIMAYIHIGLLVLVHLLPGLRAPLMAAAIAFGMVGSHMPKKFRHWSFVHGRVMDD